jgi:cytochrome c peroxidase
VLPSRLFECLSPQSRNDNFTHLGVSIDVEGSFPRAVAYLDAVPRSGQTLIHTVFPSTVAVISSDEVIPLAEQSEFDRGLGLFQAAFANGLACSSCHPMGRADSHVWSFPTGQRRTQPLEGGVSHRGAFHWNGEFKTLGDLMEQVLVQRMSFPGILTESDLNAVSAFIEAIPRPRADSEVDPDLVQAGRDLFFSSTTECTDCHESETDFTNNQIYDVGTGGYFVTPSLVGVGLRTPLLHDGCAPDLEARFGLCGGGDDHGTTSMLTSDEIAALVEYLKTL